MKKITVKIYIVKKSLKFNLLVIVEETEFRSCSQKTAKFEKESRDGLFVYSGIIAHVAAELY